MNKEQESKIDRLLAGLNQLIPQVANNKSDIHFLRSENIENKTEIARHDERIENLCEDVEATGKKICDHVVSAKLHGSNASSMKDATVRWTLIGKIAGALTGIAVLIGMVAKYI